MDRVNTIILIFRRKLTALIYLLCQKCRDVAVAIEDRGAKAVNRAIIAWENDKISKMPVLPPRQTNYLQKLILENKIIVHAGGGIQGLTYLNCAEAMETYYAKGNRLFEIDISITADGKFVCSHKRVLTSYEEFMNDKIDCRFSPMDLSMLTKRMERHDDLILILDPKFYDIQLLQRFYMALREMLGKAYLKRIVIQVRNEEEIKLCKDILCCEMLYNLFDNANYHRVARECLTYDISLVSISVEALEKRTDWDVFRRANITICVFTVNEVSVLKRMKERKIEGIFSDFLCAEDVKKYII